MGAPPPVSLFVLAYNQERFVRAAIEGAFAQSYSPLEILLSDDASPDGTFAIMQEMAAAYAGPHRVILNRNPVNLGIVGHIDRVMELTSGRLVVANAGDDVSEPDRVARLVAAWQGAGGRAMLLHSAARRIDAAGRALDIARPPERVIRDPSPATLIRDLGFVIGATAAWDRAIYDRFGPIGADIGVEDRVLPFRAGLIGEILYLDAPLVRWRIGGLSEGAARMTGRDYLYGISHRLRKWTAAIDAHVLARHGDLDYPGKDGIEAVCRARAARLQFVVDLAEAGHARRLALLPRALARARAEGSAEPLKHWLRYLFDRLYMPWADRRLARKAAGPGRDAGERAAGSRQ